MSIYKKPRYDKEQKPICEICGKSYHQLLHHVLHKHKMAAKEYRKKYKLHPRAPIVSKEHRDNLDDRFKSGKPRDLTAFHKGAKKTQFKKGNKAAEGNVRSKPALSVEEMIERLK